MSVYFNGNLGKDVVELTGGQINSVGTNQVWTATFSGTWVAGDQYTLVLTDTLSGLQTQVGAGFVSGIVPTFLFTYNNKVYGLNGSTVYFSAINDATVWNDPNGTGNGFVTLTNWYGSPDPIISMAAYQGFLAFFSRRNIQVWNVDANPNNWSINQQLPNIGIVAPKSAQPLGNLDVMFLSDTGFRSLRQLDITLAAFINDIGSPIDLIVQNSFINGNSTTNAAAYGVVEPLTTRYWCVLNGVIYVLSYFPSSKIQAWSTYTPIDSNQETMTISTLVVYQGQVWAYGQDANGNPAAWQYGGTNNNTYDKTKAKWQTGFFDAKTPGTLKETSAVDVACNVAAGGVALTNPDTWTVYCSCDEKSAGDPTSVADPTTLKWTKVYVNGSSSFDVGANAYSDEGTHFSVYAQSNGDGNSGNGGPATFSEFILHLKPENENV